MRPVEIQVKIGLARREMEYWEGILKGKKCSDCQDFQQGVCAKYNAEPPAEVQATGCDEWNWDQIPF